ncbi:MAG TPA: Gfo/Idh/MocA family oxidoreductase [Motilibacteraceae bacterium]|nr:Gfo/Idh/MocA family oxidoreductase [Motilibacteraceae bacterium]
MRFGLVGTGHWARTVHGKVLAQHPTSELIGVWGRDAGRTSATAAELEAQPYADVEALLADVDALALAVPPPVQAAHALTAARAGKHLLLDKPVALSPDDAHQLARAAEESGIASVVFFTSRFDAARRAWLYERSAATGWSGAEAAWTGNIFQPGSPYASSEWRQEHGGLWDVGPHALSMLVPLLGEVVSVQAVAGQGDTVRLLLSHVHGGTSSALLSLTAPPAAARSDLTVWGEGGVHHLPASGPAELAFATALDELVAAAEGGPAHPAGLPLGVHVVEVLAAAERALVSRAAQEVRR